MSNSPTEELGDIINQHRLDVLEYAKSFLHNDSKTVEAIQALLTAEYQRGAAMEAARKASKNYDDHTKAYQQGQRDALERVFALSPTEAQFRYWKPKDIADYFLALGELERSLEPLKGDDGGDD